jgi:hypothetical protein
MARWISESSFPCLSSVQSIEGARQPRWRLVDTPETSLGDKDDIVRDTPGVSLVRRNDSHVTLQVTSGGQSPRTAARASGDIRNHTASDSERHPGRHRANIPWKAESTPVVLGTTSARTSLGIP